jgi:hypothetical protein
VVKCAASCGWLPEKFAAGAHQKILNSPSFKPPAATPVGMGKQGLQNTGTAIEFAQSLKILFEIK